jgi:hypothetical protein
VNHIGESRLDITGMADTCSGIHKGLVGAAFASVIFNADFTLADGYIYHVGGKSREALDAILIPSLNDMGWIACESAAPSVERRSTPDYASRLRLAVGQETIDRLAGMHVGLVGLGSLGEWIHLQVLNLGCRVTAIDSDAFQMENVNRSPCGNADDVSAGASKCDIGLKVAATTAPDAQVTVINGDIRDAEVQQALKSCDFIITSTDNVTSRLVASHLAMCHGIIMIDAGTAVSVDNGVLSSVRGQVTKFIPGQNLCYGCSEFFEVNEGYQGLKSEDEYELMRTRDYVEGADIHQPSVISLNGFIASATVWELLQYVSGAQVTSPYDMVTFELLSHASRQHLYPRNEHDQRSHCLTCSLEGYALSGDQAPLLTRDKISSEDKYALSTANDSV